ncbi:condensation domain-containing protein, partial [Actinoallomurus acaciae]
VPADLSLVALTPAEEREVAALGVGVEEILPLSPLQTGLYFHALLDEEGPDLYTVQLVVELTGPVDAGRLRAAAQRLLDRHGNLRASFHQLGTGKAVAVVARGVT